MSVIKKPTPSRSLLFSVMFVYIETGGVMGEFITAPITDTHSSNEEQARSRRWSWVGFGLCAIGIAAEVLDCRL